MKAIEAMFAKVGLDVDPKKTPQQLRMQYIHATRRRLNATNSTDGGDNGADNGQDADGGDNGQDASDTSGGDNGADNGQDAGGDNGADNGEDGGDGSVDAASGGDAGGDNDGTDSSSVVLRLTAALVVVFASLVLA